MVLAGQQADAGHDAVPVGGGGIGVNYTARAYAFGLEALIPGNWNTGSHLGVIAQFHLYFDDLFPHGLGKPIAAWF